MSGSHRTAWLVALVAALALAACGDESNETAGGDLPFGCEPVEPPAAKEVDLRRPKATLQGRDQVSALVETSCGPFEIALATARSPKTTSSFAFLAEHSFYEDTSISYVDGSVVQGGDPAGDRTGGPGYFIDEPPPFKTEYTRGTVAMAKTEVEPIGRSGSQFFVVYEQDAGLPPEFALLGRVTEGMDVIDRIAELRVPGSDTGAPEEPVAIERVTLVR